MRLVPIYLFLLLAPVLRAGEPASPASSRSRIAELIRSMERSDLAGQKACRELIALGKPAVESLLQALKSPVPRVRYWSVAALGRIGEKRAIEPLVQLLQADPDPLVRSTVVWYLQFFQDDRVWPIVVGALRDRNRMVRGWAIRSLEENHRPEAEAELRKLLQHPDAHTRYDALAALIRVLKSGHQEVIRSMMKDREPLVRTGALRCLTLLEEKRPEILEPMIEALLDEDRGVRATAARLLRKGANQSFGYNAEAPPPVLRSVAARWRAWYRAHKDQIVWNEQTRRFDPKEGPTP